MAPTGLDIETVIDFLADLPAYEDEKPYYLHASDLAGERLDEVKITNVEWDKRPVTVHSMRDEAGIGLEESGFSYIQHESKHIPHAGIMTPERAADYRAECEDLLRSVFKAEFAHCYDFKLRKNTPMALEKFDPKDPCLVEEAAVGAHGKLDVTVDTVPRLIKPLLDEQQLRTFFQPGYRFRLINIWRSILPECQDRPLAVCDYASIDPSDLVATDRVYPGKLQEIYHLKYNSQQRWYWLPNQRSDEPFLFLTYDSKSGSNARYCPHVSINNPLAPSDAPPRESVETRNLVITKL
ncbi:hypothetical protein QBC39DRAFT_354705 [Podospora conica]|nr:hypothetical protein QBC39DRAFT_354705 [Schizothecium conicum]